jgi:hypothetical protein
MPTTPLHDQIWELYLKGLTYAQIMQEVGCTYGTADEIIKVRRRRLRKSPLAEHKRATDRRATRNREQTYQRIEHIEHMMIKVLSYLRRLSGEPDDPIDRRLAGLD